jgi:surface polysaccharide O-acyltransferase-like enzyme
MKHRMREMDYIRAVSALSIIMIHVSGVYTVSSRGAFAVNQLVRFAVPVFILISGLLLSLSGYKYAGIAEYIRFIKKRLRKIFIPYVLWSIIYILFNRRNDLVPIWHNPGSFLADTGKKLLLGTGHVHLYFIIIILQLYLLYPALYCLMKYNKKLVLACSFVLTLVFQTGIYLQAMKIITFPAPILPNYMFFPTWIFFFVFGMYFAGNLDAHRDWIGRRTGPIALVWASSFVLLMLDSRFTVTLDLSIKPTVLLYSMTAFLLMYSLCLKLKDSGRKLLKGLDWISFQSFTIYLSHLFIIKIIILLTGHAANTGLWGGFKGMLVLYSAGTICTCLFAYVVSIMPSGSVLGGVKKSIAKKSTAYLTLPD